MTRNQQALADTTRILTALDLTRPHTLFDAGIRATSNRADDWFDTYDFESGLPAVAQIVYATDEEGMIEEWLDADNAHALLVRLVDSGDYDPDHGIQVTVSAYWLLYTHHDLAAA
ncbi:hypothetical protein QNA24_30030 [Rhodococcus qingshengii]|uniref:hypothetical protein n=1 Tax=Rhodococcus TaxID=1827 RepID=UPI001E49C326|nr:MULTISPECIES: hypothetical protein [Rhodococcus]MCD2099609.1 hypothetical protein [Rhodococcus rhodochrous]MCD2123977.1 hypothetical protein [Rhodococcus rhodochrous]MCQ4136591.1 hypothetical protein [Rhodococcus rhodochrous]MDJ0490623.1 hypothetical protein [Rhodococcus qingshengii]